MSSGFVGPELLDESHDVSEFDCGIEPLNTFIKRFAFQNQRNNSSRTFVVIRESRVVGYYSLCAAAASYQDAPERIRKGLAKHEIPLILLARLAVDRSAQGEGLGYSLLLDVFARFLTAQESIGARGLIAHAKDASAKAFYEKWGFVATEGLPYHLYILAKDIKATIASN